MADTKHKPSANGSHSVYVLKEEYRKDYIINTLDKFLDEHVFDEENIGTTTDGVWCYGVNILRSFMLLADLKDAVATGNGEYLSVIRKQLLLHFFSTPGFNKFAVEMFVNILQCQKWKPTTVNGLLQSSGKVELATILKLTYFRKTGTVK